MKRESNLTRMARTIKSIRVSVNREDDRKAVVESPYLKLSGKKARSI